MENKKSVAATNGKRNSDSSNTQRKSVNSEKDAEDNNEINGTNSRQNNVDSGQPVEKPKSSRKNKSNGKGIHELQKLVAKLEAYCYPDRKTRDCLHRDNLCAVPMSRRVSACLYGRAPCHGATRNVFACVDHGASHWPSCPAAQPVRLGGSGRHALCFGPACSAAPPSPPSHRSRMWRNHHHQRKRCQWQRPCRHRRALCSGLVPEVPADGLGLLGGGGQPDPFRNLGCRLPFGVEPEELVAARAVMSTSCSCRPHTQARTPARTTARTPARTPARRSKRSNVSPPAAEIAPKPKRRKKSRRTSQSPSEGIDDIKREGTCPALGANYRCAAGSLCKCGMLAQGPYGELVGDSCPVLGTGYVCTGRGGVGGDVGGYDFNAAMEANPQIASCPILGPDYLCGDSNIMGQGTFQPYGNTDYVGAMASSFPILGPDYDYTADPNRTDVMNWQDKDQRDETDTPCPILGTDYICGDSGVRNAMQMSELDAKPCPFLGSDYVCTAQDPQTASGPCSCAANLQAGEASTPCPILGTDYDCSGRSDIFQGMPSFEMQRTLATGRQCTCGYQQPPDDGAGQVCPILGSSVVCSGMGATNTQLPSDSPCPILGSDVICSGGGGGVNQSEDELSSSGWSPSFGNMQGFGLGNGDILPSPDLGSDGVYPGEQAFSGIGSDAPCPILGSDVVCSVGGTGGGAGGEGAGESAFDGTTLTTEPPCPILGPSVVCSGASLHQTRVQSQESKQDSPVSGPEVVFSGVGINSNAGYQPIENEVPSTTFASQVSGTDCPCPSSPSCPPFVYVVPFEQPSMASYGRIQGFVVAFEESPRAPFKCSRMEPILSTKCSGVFSSTKTCSSTDPVLQLLDAKSQTRASLIDSSIQTSQSSVSIEPSPYQLRKVGLAARSSLQTLWPNGSLGNSTPSGDISRDSLGGQSRSVSFGSSFWNENSESTDRGTSTMRMPRDSIAVAKVRSLDSFRERRSASRMTTEFTTQHPSATELRTCEEIALGASGTSVCVVLKESSIQTSLQSIPDTIVPSRPSHSASSQTKKPRVTLSEETPELRTCEEIALGASGISVCAYKETSIQTSSDSIPSIVRPSQIKNQRPNQIKELKIKKSRPIASQETRTSPVRPGRVLLKKEIVPVKRKKKKKSKKVPMRDCSTQVDLCECAKKPTSSVSASKLKEKKEGNVTQASQTCPAVNLCSCTPKERHRGSRSRKGKCESCGNPVSTHVSFPKCKYIHPEMNRDISFSPSYDNLCGELSDML